MKIAKSFLQVLQEDIVQETIALARSASRSKAPALRPCYTSTCSLCERNLQKLEPRFLQDLAISLAKTIAPSARKFAILFCKKNCSLQALCFAPRKKKLQVCGQWEFAFIVQHRPRSSPIRAKMWCCKLNCCAFSLLYFGAFVSTFRSHAQGRVWVDWPFSWSIYIRISRAWMRVEYQMQRLQKQFKNELTWKTIAEN